MYKSEPIPKITLVTGLWDIRRSELSANWSRPYSDYLQQFRKLLQIDCNMIIFGAEELSKTVFEHRTENNTQFVNRNIEWFKSNNYYEKIQSIRTNQTWLNLSSWLKDSTQAALELYNPLVMSKMFLLNDSRILDKFNSDYLFWIDAGLAFTVNMGYFTHDLVHTKLSHHVSNFMFIAFPYDANTEVHGFEYNALCEFADTKTKIVSRGGFFGGRKNVIEQLNSIYYDLLITTLDRGLMGTEESIFTIMTYLYPELISYFEIGYDGLIWPFFENLKNNSIMMKQIKKTNKSRLQPIRTVKTHLYILTFNFPEQLKALLESFDAADTDFLNKTTKFLINNSTDPNVKDQYDLICTYYGFEQIRKNNIGICRGRQFVAEHFDASDADYYIFFEDDMMLFQQTNDLDKNGFGKFIPNLYSKTLNIMQSEGYDYLKLNFTEIYGSNSTQWAWYNISDLIRHKYFPNKKTKPQSGLDPDPPATHFTNIRTQYGVSYIEGDIYYCNWPMWFSKEGNRKVFLETKFDYPYEQTWMSLVFQKQKKNEISAACMLLSPINHNRIQYYAADERREN